MTQDEKIAALERQVEELRREALDALEKGSVLRAQLQQAQYGVDAHNHAIQLAEAAEARVADLERERVNFFDTLRAIAVQGLGLTDPWEETAPANPEDWSRHATLSEAVADLRRKLAESERSRAELQQEIAEQASRETAWARKFEDQIRHFAVHVDNERRRLLLKWRADRRRLRASRAELQQQLAKEEQEHLQTIAARDLREEQVQAIHVALGGDGEWTSCRDLGRESLEMIAGLKQQLEEARGLLEHATAFQFGGKAPNMARRVEDLPIRIEARDQRDGTRKWAVMQGGNCLRRDGLWELEMQPSSRTDEFLRMARWTLNEALDAARSQGGENAAQ